jgi:hypothetical protein
MPKLTLDLDALRVSTFAPQEANAAEAIIYTLESFGCTTTLKTQTTSD